jgi:hypothetical protein
MATFINRGRKLSELGLAAVGFLLMRASGPVLPLRQRHCLSVSSRNEANAFIAAFPVLRTPLREMVLKW